jgi:hypothetical protein
MNSVLSRYVQAFSGNDPYQVALTDDASNQVARPISLRFGTQLTIQSKKPHKFSSPDRLVGHSFHLETSARQVLEHYGLVDALNVGARKCLIEQASFRHHGHTIGCC